MSPFWTQLNPGLYFPSRISIFLPNSWFHSALQFAGYRWFRLLIESPRLNLQSLLSPIPAPHVQKIQKKPGVISRHELKCLRLQSENLHYRNSINQARLWLISVLKEASALVTSLTDLLFPINPLFQSVPILAFLSLLFPSSSSLLCTLASLALSLHSAMNIALRMLP